MEKRSRRRKSTDLRVSLGRKSVGDVPGIGETPNASLNESCHLNPDSAIIDPDVAANPEWFQHLEGNSSVLVSQRSVNEAILNERDANIINDSNVDRLNLSSFDRRQINKVLNSSVVVNTSEIKRLTKRKQKVLSEDVDADAESSDEDNEASVKSKSKSKASTSSTFSRKSMKLPENDESLEIKRKRPAFLEKRKKRAVSNDNTQAELFNAFKQGMEQSVDSETDTSKQVLPSAPTGVDERDTSTKDLSIEIPRRRPNFLRKSIKKDNRKSVDAYKIFSEAMDQTSDISETEVNAGPQENLKPTSSKRGSATVTGKHASPQASDISIDLPRRRPAFLKKKSKGNRDDSQDLHNIFKEAMEQSESEAGTDVSNQISPSADANQSHSKSLAKDVSVEIPQRRPGFLKKGPTSTSTYDDAYKAFSDVISGFEDEDESAAENPLPASRAPSEMEVDSSLPLGAEATNFGDDAVEDIPTTRKRTLSLKKLHSGNEVNVLSQVAEEESIKASQASAAPNTRHSRLNLPEHGDVSRLTNASATEHTRSAAVRVSHLGEREHIFPMEMEASPAASEKHLSMQQGDGHKSHLSLTGSLQVPHLSLRSNKSMGSIGVSPAASKRQSTSKSGPFPTNNSSLPDIINSPLSSRESLASRLVSNSKRGSLSKNVPPQQSSAPQAKGSESDDDGAMTTISNASTVSLPSNLTSNLPGFVPQNTSRRSASTTTRVDLPSADSSSVFVSESLESGSKSLRRLQSEADSSLMSQSNEIGSDSVFSSSISKSRKSNLSVRSDRQVRNASHESSWTENPYVDFAKEQISRKESPVAEGEAFEEELSPIEAADDENYIEDPEEDDSPSSTEEHNNVNEAEVQPMNVSISSPVGVSRPTLEPAPSSSGVPTENNEKRRSIFSPLSDSARLQPAARKEATGPKTASAQPPKVYSEKEMEKMKLFMSNWTKEVHQGLHISKPLPPEPKPAVFKKPEPKRAPKVTKKKEVCPYLEDYRPPKRVKPKPYVTAKMYKFLENKLQAQFGLESRIKAEEFVEFLCDTVTSVIKKKSKYHKLVFDLRDKMVSLGIISTQLQYHVFIEDYLPDSFRVKSIPCYGCPKGPKLDTNDLNQVLSVK